jgi:hypothetical protein
MAEFPRDYQILLADDASTDGTAQVVDPYRHVLPLILLRSHQRRGYAASLEMLIREAARRSRYPRRDIVVVMQADFSEDADCVPALLRRMESGADLVVGGPVTSAVRPGLLERTSDRITRGLLRRKPWPEPVTDPLNGFSAIRLACIRKALEELPEGRLLRWEGRTANAALLGAVAPHARRIDAIEMTLHPERRQRPRRSGAVAILREVYRFVRDIPAPGLAAPESLVPDEVHGDLSALRRREDRPEEPRRNAPRRPAPKPGDGPTERPQRGRTKAGAGEQPRGPARKDGKPRRPRRKPEPVTAEADGGPAAEGAGPAEGAEGEAADGKTAPKRRRGSRGGARNRRRSKPTDAEGEANGAKAGGNGPQDAAAAGPDANAPADGPPKRRRRGGRSRSGRRPRKDGGPNDQPGNAPDPSGPGSQQKDGE